ncbi:unnamed protein product [Lupinus luteus]|uniref:RNase H type-1 domain-containing protein n=1 Tax=Lupinus luteus TaxID=3873 RepID=A0AAV1XPS3_LUPLU
MGFECGLDGCLRELLEGIRWTIGNSTSVKFWRDCWLGSIIIIEQVVVQPLPNEVINMIVEEYMLPGRSWNWHNFVEFVSEVIFHEILVMPCFIPSAGQDVHVWRFSVEGVYSTRSAYDMLLLDEDPHLNLPIWKTVWKWKGVQSKCASLGIISSDLFPICGDAAETVLHVLCDCLGSSSVWEGFVDYHHAPAFFSMEFSQWVSFNLNHRHLMCTRMFSCTLWSLWRMRNDIVFRQQSWDSNTILSYANFILFDDSVANVDVQEQLTSRSGTGVWRSPDPEWFKFNVDGSVRLDGEGSCGRVLRDCNELWGIVTAMNIALEEGRHKVVFETDSRAAMDMIFSVVELVSPYAQLVNIIRRVISLHDEFKFQFIHREANVVVDCLAKHAHVLHFGVQVLHNPTLECYTLLSNDALQASLSLSAS